MAKAKKSTKSDYQYLIDTKIPLEPEDAHLVEGGVFHVLLSSNTIKMIPVISEALIASREIPILDRDEMLSDRLYLQMLLEHPKIERDRLIRMVQAYYGKLIKAVTDDATIIALTDNVGIAASIDENGQLIRPSDYTPKDVSFITGEPSIKDADVVPVWRRDVVPIDWPDVNYDLDNPYEARLKHLNDLMNSFSPLFQLKITEILNDCLVESLRRIGQGETDDDNFQLTTIN